MLCREISNLARQLKFSPEIGDVHPVISHLTTNLWLRSIELTILGSTSSANRPINDRKNKAAVGKQLESVVYRLNQEKGCWPFLTSRLENVTDKTMETAPPLIKQVGVLTESARTLREKGTDGGHVCCLSKRDHYRRFLEGARHERLDQEFI